jgi:hypothetical protein
MVSPSNHERQTIAPLTLSLSKGERAKTPLGLLRSAAF